MGDVTSNRQPMRVREAERESAAEGGCVFLSLQHQQREEEQNQFHSKEKEKAQVEKEQWETRASRSRMSEGASL